MDKGVMNDTVVYSVLKYSSLLLAILTTTIIIKSLEVSIFGIYTVLILVYEYARLIYRPSLAAGQKRIPSLRGQGKKGIQEVRDRTFAPTFYLVLLIAFVIFASSFIGFSQNIRDGLRISALIVMLQHFYFFHTNFLRADKMFAKVGLIELTLNMCRLLLTLVLVSWGLNGVLLAYVAAYAITIAVGFWLAPYKYSFSFSLFSLGSIRFIIRYGLAPALVFIITTAFLTIDRWVIIRFFDSVQLGYYGFAVFIITLVGYVPQIIGGVMFPRQIEAYGKNRKLEDMKPYLVKPVIAISMFVPLVISGAYIFAEVFITAFAPKYLEALIVCYILMFVSYFSSVGAPIINFMVAIDREKLFIKVRAIMLAFALLLNLALVSLGYGIAGVAVATLAAFMLEYIALCYICSRLSGSDSGESARFTMASIMPFLYMVVALALLSSFTIEGTMLAEFSYDALKYIGFLALTTPMYIYLNKKTGILRVFLKEYLPGFKRSVSKILMMDRF